jgi:hypothetical protein
MTIVYPPSEIDKRQTSPNANVTKVTTVSVDIFMFFDTDFMFGIGRSPPRSTKCKILSYNFYTKAPSYFAHFPQLSPNFCLI